MYMASSGQIVENLSAKHKPNLLYFAFNFFFSNAKSKDLADFQIYRNFRFKTKPRYLLYTVLPHVFFPFLFTFKMFYSHF